MVIVAFVSVPKDLTKVKNKVVLNLTKRQLICLVIAAAVGLPFYFLTRSSDWNKQCGNRYGHSYASGIYVCHV